MLKSLRTNLYRVFENPHIQEYWLYQLIDQFATHIHLLLGNHPPNIRLLHYDNLNHEL